MTTFISHLTVDCHNAYELSEWWKVLLGYTDSSAGPNGPGEEECMIVDPAGNGPRLLFIEVSDVKSVKNRLHLDVRPHERIRDDEVVWAIEHGAKQIADHRGTWGPGSGWVVLADPEGNEFCILRSEAEAARPST